MRRLVRSATTPTSGGDSRKPPRSSQLTMVSPVPGGRPGSSSAVCMAAGTRVATPQPGEREPGQGGGDGRHGEGGAHADGGERPAGADDGALAEPVDDPVAGEPADGHGDLRATKARPAAAAPVCRSPLR